MQSQWRRLGGPAIGLLLSGCAPVGQPPTIEIVSATYGAVCGAPLGNATQHIATECRDRSLCLFRVDNHFGDPARGCGKDFYVQYRCGRDPTIHAASHPGVKGEKYLVTLSCEGPVVETAATVEPPARPSPLHRPMTFPAPPAPPAPGPSAAEIAAMPRINVVSATYGANCGASKGNATNFVAFECRDRTRCCYLVDNRDGDPRRGCGKDFVVEYRCGVDPTVRQARHPGRLGEGYVVELSCTDLHVDPRCADPPPRASEDEF